MKNNIERVFLLFIGDIAILIASFFMTLHIGFYGELTPEIISLHIVPFSILYLFWILVLFLFNLYEIRLSKPTISNLKNMGQALVICLVVGFVFFYAMPEFLISPKGNLIINIAVFGALFFGWRRIFFLVFAKYFKTNIAFLAPRENSSAEELFQHIQNNPQTGYNTISRFETPEEFFNSKSSDINILVVDSQFLQNPAYFNRIFKTNTHIVELSKIYEILLSKISLNTIDESWFVHKISFETDVFYTGVKRLLDILVSSVGIIALSPFFIVSALAIWISDKGPIFYTQTRNGKNNTLFHIIKFRSMKTNAEKSGVQWAEKNDPRITKIGRILRKTHIDELPQLFNILKGDITLVGPRPERPEFVAELEQQIPFYHLRHTIKPGFTGWAQIKFRYARSIDDSKEKFEYDLYYIKNRNLILDAGIIIKTIQIIFTH